MNGRMSWDDIYPKNKKWNDTRKCMENATQKPAIPRPTFDRQSGSLNALGQAFLPAMTL